MPTPGSKPAEPPELSGLIGWGKPVVTLYTWLRS
jgi:hypothetical protein